MNLKNIISIFIVILLAIILLLVFNFINVDQEERDFEITSNKSFDLEGNESGSFIISTKDKGCILTGHIDSNNQELLVIKNNNEGNQDWNKTYGGNRSDFGKIVFENDDETYMILGTTNSYSTNIYDANMWLLKVDSEGNEIWNKTYGGIRWEEGNSLISDDEDFILAGSSSSYSVKDFDTNAWLLKVDNNGNEIWNKSFGSIGFDEGRSIVKTSDDSYVIAGRAKSFGDGDSDAWAIKVNNSVNEIWNYTYGFEYEDLFNQVILVDDGLVFAGHTEIGGTGNWSGYIVKTDFQGEKIWDLVIDNTLAIGTSSIVKTPQGFIATGYKGPYGQNQDNLILVKISDDGDKLWEKTIDAEYSGAGVWIDKKTEDTFVITGYTSEDESGKTDLWFLEVKIEE